MLNDDVFCNKVLVSLLFISEKECPLWSFDLIQIEYTTLNVICICLNQVIVKTSTSVTYTMCVQECVQSRTCVMGG